MYVINYFLSVQFDNGKEIMVPEDVGVNIEARDANIELNVLFGLRLPLNVIL